MASDALGASIPRPPTSPENTTSSSSAARRARRLPTLTGLRFPAALLVFAFHAALPFPTMRLLADDDVAKGFYTGVAQSGGLGVMFFFILSGFVLAWSAPPGDTARSFWRRRYIKIVPNYVVTWGIALALIAWTTTKPWPGAVSLVMLQAWVPDVPTFWAVNAPGWSLSVEALFYLCFPLLYGAARRIDPARLKYWIAGTVAAIAATPAVAYALVPATGQVVPNEPSEAVGPFWFAYILPPARLGDFALGVLVARAVMTGRWRNAGMVWSGALLVAAYVVASFVPLLYGLRVVCVVPAVMLIAAGAIADTQGRYTLFRNRAATWLGEISFAFYLMHFVVLMYSRKLLGDGLFSTPVAVGIVLAQAAGSVLLAWALYALVERPLVIRWSRPRRRASTNSTIFVVR